MPGGWACYTGSWSTLQRCVAASHAQAQPRPACTGRASLAAAPVRCAQPEIATALRLVAAALRRKEPVLVFCKAGKDRTGIVSALLLLVAGASEKEVVADYAR